MAELGEGEKRLVLVQQLAGWHIKIYEEADYSFHAVFTSEDFANLAELKEHINSLLEGLTNAQVRQYPTPMVSTLRSTPESVGVLRQVR